MNFLCVFVTQPDSQICEDFRSSEVWAVSICHRKPCSRFVLRIANRVLRIYSLHPSSPPPASNLVRWGGFLSTDLCASLTPDLARPDFMQTQRIWQGRRKQLVSDKAGQQATSCIKTETQTMWTLCVKLQIQIVAFALCSCWAITTHAAEMIWLQWGWISTLELQRRIVYASRVFYFILFKFFDFHFSSLLEMNTSTKIGISIMSIHQNTIFNYTCVLWNCPLLAQDGVGGTRRVGHLPAILSTYFRSYVSAFAKAVPSIVERLFIKALCFA